MSDHNEVISGGIGTEPSIKPDRREDVAANFLRRTTDQMKSSNSMLWNMFGIMVCFWLVVVVTAALAYFMGRASATAVVNVEPIIKIPPLDLGDLPKPPQPIFYVISPKSDEKSVTVNENFTFPDMVRVRLEEPKATTVDPQEFEPDPDPEPVAKPTPVEKPEPDPAKPKKIKKETKLDRSKIRILPPPKGIPRHTEVHANSVWNEAESLYSKQKWEEAQRMYLYFRKDHNKSQIYQSKKDILVSRLKAVSQKIK